MQEIEVKLAVHQAAAVLTAGVVSNLPDTINLDAEIKDPAVQAQNLMAWQLHKIFYHGIVGALNSTDGTSWPTPKMPAAPTGLPAAGGKPDGSVITAFVNGLVQLGAPGVVQALTPEAMAALKALVSQIPAGTAASTPATSAGEAKPAPALPT